MSMGILITDTTMDIVTRMEMDTHMQINNPLLRERIIVRVKEVETSTLMVLCFTFLVTSLTQSE